MRCGSLPWRMSEMEEQLTIVRATKEKNTIFTAVSLGQSVCLLQVTIPTIRSEVKCAKVNRWTHKWEQYGYFGNAIPGTREFHMKVIILPLITGGSLSGSIVRIAGSSQSAGNVVYLGTTCAVHAFTAALFKIDVIVCQSVVSFALCQRS